MPLDFLSEVFEPGRRFRIAAVIDGGTRECLTLVAREFDGLIRLEDLATDHDRHAIQAGLSASDDATTL